MVPGEWYCPLSDVLQAYTHCCINFALLASNRGAFSARILYGITAYNILLAILCGFTVVLAAFCGCILVIQDVEISLYSCFDPYFLMTPSQVKTCIYTTYLIDIFFLSCDCSDIGR